MKGEWISVADKIPSEGTPVWGASIGQFPTMVCAIHGPDEDWHWEIVVDFFIVDQEWCCGSVEDDDYSWIDRWMPLPDPPK